MGEMFANCTSLKELIIGTGITQIGFGLCKGCTSLERFYIKAVTPPELGGNCFLDCPVTIYVPIGSGEAYKSATNWKTYASQIVEYDFSLNPDNIPPTS